MEDLELAGDESREREEQVEEVVAELLAEAQAIRHSTGVGCPQIAKHVAAWADTWQGEPSDKAGALQALAAQLHQRRPILYLRGSPDPVAANVVVRSVRKPGVAALSRGPAAAASLFKAPDNSFIVIRFDAAHAPADIIVDPFFTDAFVQRPSSPTLDRLLARLPRAFVGTAAELRRLVALLTSQSLRAYASNGASSPPWRRFDSMLARWLPKSFSDAVVGGSSNGSTASGFSAWLQLNAAAAASSDGSSLGSSPSSLPASSSSSASSSSASSSSVKSSASSVRTIYGFDLAGAAAQEGSGATEAAATTEAAAAKPAAATETAAAASQQLPAPAVAADEGEEAADPEGIRNQGGAVQPAGAGAAAPATAAPAVAAAGEEGRVRGGSGGRGIGVVVHEEGRGDGSWVAAKGRGGGGCVAVKDGAGSGGCGAGVSIKDLEVVGLTGVLAKWRQRLRDLQAAQQQQGLAAGAGVARPPRAARHSAGGSGWGRPCVSSSAGAAAPLVMSWCAWQGCSALEA